MQNMSAGSIHPQQAPSTHQDEQPQLFSGAVHGTTSVFLSEYGPCGKAIYIHAHIGPHCSWSWPWVEMPQASPGSEILGRFTEK